MVGSLPGCARAANGRATAEQRDELSSIHDVPLSRCHCLPVAGAKQSKTRHRQRPPLANKIPAIKAGPEWQKREEAPCAR
jgi:hypothetical protein